MKQKRKEKDMINYYEWFEFLQFLENGQKNWFFKNLFITVLIVAVINLLLIIAVKKTYDYAFDGGNGNFHLATFFLLILFVVYSLSIFSDLIHYTEQLPKINKYQEISKISSAEIRRRGKRLIIFCKSFENSSESNNYFCKNGKADEQTFNEVFYTMNYFSKSEKSDIEKAVEFISK